MIVLNISQVIDICYLSTCLSSELDISSTAELTETSIFRFGRAFHLFNEEFDSAPKIYPEHMNPM